MVEEKKEGTMQEEKTDEEPQVFAVKRDLTGWRFSRRDFLAAASGAVVAIAAGAAAGCKGPEETATPTEVLPTATDTPAPMDPGQAFTKIWRVENRGAIPWDEGMQLVFADGTQMGGTSPVPVGDVMPGETVDISVNMVAPTESGEYTGRWRLQAADSTAMITLTVNIVVEAPPGEPGEVPPGETGINFIGPGGETRTMPCGSPIPPGWTCTCDCVTVPPACTCVGHCSCDGQGTHYWYPC